MLKFQPNGIRRYDNTHVRVNLHSAVVTLHNIDIAVIRYTTISDDGFNYTVTLNSGNHRTGVIRKRMNEIAEELNLDFSVFKRNGTWWIDSDGCHMRFSDRITFGCHCREN